MFTKAVYEGKIIGVGISDNYGNITEEEYDNITELLRNIPDGYYLAADTLQYTELQDSDGGEEATEEDYINALSELGIM